MNSTDAGKQVVLRFLRDYIDFGSWGHIYSAKALLNQISGESSDIEKDLLCVKLYTEFFLSLEDLAALCISIRHREENVGLIYHYLTYGKKQKGIVGSNTSIQEMFEKLDVENPLSSVLLLPSLAEIGTNSPDLTTPEFISIYAELNILLRNLARLYLFDNKAFVRAFNKTKHGFVVVRDANIFQADLPDIKPGSSWIITDNPDYHPVNAKHRPVVEKFLNQTKDARAFHDRITLIRGAIVALCQIVIVLLEKSLIRTADGAA